MFIRKIRPTNLYVLCSLPDVPQNAIEPKYIRAMAMTNFESDMYFGDATKLINVKYITAVSFEIITRVKSSLGRLQ